ncbi:hypothetical protein [Sorangium sp. So ce1389]|uniref:hypothetical protein n=1 Tax=Sorangium sp. So ce1389 TaxID=3133336 RepID=UPI003F5F907A
MARTAPVPNIPAIPGMNPGTWIMGGGGGGGGGNGRGGRGRGGKQGAGGRLGLGFGWTHALAWTIDERRRSILVIEPGANPTETPRPAEGASVRLPCGKLTRHPWAT